MCAVKRNGAKQSSRLVGGFVATSKKRRLHANTAVPARFYCATKYPLEGFSEPLAYVRQYRLQETNSRSFVPSRAVLDRRKTLEFESTELLKNCLQNSVT